MKNENSFIKKKKIEFESERSTVQNDVKHNRISMLHRVPDIQAFQCSVYPNRASLVLPCYP